MLSLQCWGYNEIITKSVDLYNFDKLYKLYKRKWNIVESNLFFF